jgi:hypothetical protein
MRAAKSLLIVLPAIAAAPAFGAQFWQQPIGYLGVEQNSNLDLTPGGQGSSMGYVGSLADIIGIGTPETTTTIKPRIDYREYPNDTSDNRLEGYLDFDSSYKSQRSSANIFGEIDHRDELNAELSQAVYDDVNPNAPTQPQTGRTQTGATRDSGYVVPSYAFNVTQRVAVGASGMYQKVNYSPNDDVRYVNFDYYQGKLFTTWTFTQNSDLTFGAYENHFNATRYDSSAKAEGGSVDLSTSWTPLFSTRAGIVVQHSEIDNLIPPAFNGSVNTWGGSFSAIYKGEVQQLRADLSRNITPSGGGSVYVNEQAQLEYDRRITQRLTLTTAALYLRNRGLTPGFNENARNYLRTVVEGKWMITPTWFVQGGYQYLWQKYTENPDGAANNRIYLRIGYQGLNRQW